MDFRPFRLQPSVRRPGTARLPGVSASGLSPALQASSFPSRLARPHRPNRVHGGGPFGPPVLRTGRSRSVALHPALLRRSYGSIPHDSSPHRSGLPPLLPLAFSGALGRALRCPPSGSAGAARNGVRALPAFTDAILSGRWNVRSSVSANFSSSMCLGERGRLGRRVRRPAERSSSAASSPYAKIKRMIVRGIILKNLLLIPLTIIPLTLASSGNAAGREFRWKEPLELVAKFATTEFRRNLPSLHKNPVADAPLSGKTRAAPPFELLQILQQLQYHPPIIEVLDMLGNDRFARRKNSAI